MKRATHNKVTLRISLFFILFIYIALIFNTVFISFSMRRSSINEKIKLENAVHDRFSGELDQMTTTAKSLLLQFYNSSTVRQITTYDTLSDTDLLTLKSQLSDYYFPERYTYNYYLFNCELERICTNQQLFSYDTFFDREILAYIDNNDNIAQFTPIFRNNVSVIGSNEKYDFFTYIQYDNYADHKPASYIMVNISCAWVDEIMANYCDADEQMLLFDSKGNPIVTSSAGFTLEKDSYDKIFKKCAPGTAATLRIQNKNYVIISSYTNNDSWLSVRLIPTGSIYHDQNIITGIIFLIGLITLAAATGMYFVIRNYLLAPIDRIFDEYSHLQDLQSANTKLLKKSAITFLQSPDNSADNEAALNLFDQLCAPADGDDPVVLCLCRFDRFSEMSDRFDAQSRAALLFAISNVAQDLFEPFCKVCGMSMDERTELIILNHFHHEPIRTEQILSTIKKLQEFMVQNLNFSFSAFLSDPQPFYLLKECYQQTHLQLDMRFLKGHGCLITPDCKTGISENYLPMSPRINSVLERLKLRDYKNAFEIIRESMDSFVTSFETACQFNIRISGIITDYCFEMQKSEQSAYWQSVGVDFRKKSENAETLEELYQVYEWLKNTLTEYDSKSDKNEDYQHIIEQVKEIVEERHSDYNLSLQSICENLPLSPVYIGRIFRKYYNCSVSDYINQVRLDRVAKLLATTDLLIQDIALQCGFENKTYLFTLFKKRFGLTPSQYKKIHSNPK